MSLSWQVMLRACRPLVQSRARLAQPSVALAEQPTAMPPSGPADHRGALPRLPLRRRGAGLRTGRLRLLGR